MSKKFATQTELPDGSTITDSGWLPAVKGEPVIAVRAPVEELIVYAETYPVVPFPLKSATYAKLPEGSTATDIGDGSLPEEAPVVNGDPAMEDSSIASALDVCSCRTPSQAAKGAETFGGDTPAELNLFGWSMGLNDNDKLNVVIRTVPFGRS